MNHSFLACLPTLILAAPLWANPPDASYIFPAGGQRGTTVKVRVGGLYLHEKCGWEMLGPGIKANKELLRIPTIWFDGPMLLIPESQRAENYPKDMAGTVQIAADAPLRIRPWRLWTSQGATPARKFVVGDLPEVVENEIAGDPIPVPVKLPVTINGRIFPRGNMDLWSFEARKGQTICSDLVASRLGSPLEGRLEILDARGRKIAENDTGVGPDPRVIFTVPADGTYQVRVRDGRGDGGQTFVYRLTLTAGPFVETVFPLGGRRGQIIDIEVQGKGLPPGRHAITLPTEQAPMARHVLTFDKQRTNAFALDVDDLPEYLTQAQPVALPAVLNGRIAKPGTVDRWTWSGRKGEVWEFDLRAVRLGSTLDGVLTILDSADKELARAEMPAPGQPDPKLVFTVPADGQYRVQVRERLLSRGGPAFGYRLRVNAPPPPDYHLWLDGNAVTLSRGGQVKLKLTAERLGGFKEPILLAVAGLPPGVSANGFVIGPGQTSVELVLKADASARIDVARLTIQGSAQVGRATVNRQARSKTPAGETPVDTVLVGVALPTPFRIKGDYVMGWAAMGAPYQRSYKIERTGFEGPIEVSLADSQARTLQGVTGPPLVVPAGANQFTYAIQMAPAMETGRTCRVCVMGVATVKDKDGSEHRVSFSSTDTKEQFIAVIGPSKLSLELERDSFTVSPRQPTTIAVTVKRAPDLKGAIRLEVLIPPHIRRLKSEPITIAASKDRGELRIVCSQPGQPLNMPLTIRATLMHDGRPIVAETRIDVQPE